jgi:hypothetical protein
MARIFIAGQEVYEAASAERSAAVEASGIAWGAGRSEVLCKVQERQAGRGLTGIHIVKSMYGYSVRYDSGLQNFGLLRAARGSRDPSFEAAVEFCRDWVAAHPECRYAWHNEECW